MHPRKSGLNIAINAVPSLETKSEGTEKVKRGPKLPAQESKPCVVCHELIQRGAGICIHCDSVQDWTRHIFRWTGVLTAVLALLPLWTGASALRELAFPHHKSDVRFHPIVCTRERMILAVTNSGDRAGIMTEFSLVIVVDSREAKEKFALIPQKERRIVRPGETFTLNLEPRVEGVPAPLPASTGLGKTCEYRIAMQVDAFDLGTYSATVNCPCAGPAVGSPAP